MIVQHYLQLVWLYRKLVFKITAITTVITLGLSVLWLLAYPLYTGTASVVMLPTEAELAFTASWVGQSQYHPANVMTQTQMEYIISRPVAEKTLQTLAAELAAMPQPTGFSAWLKNTVIDVQMALRYVYNMLNSGTFVKLTPYEDMLQKLRDGISVEVVEGSYILQISSTLPDARAAALAANTIARSYDEMIAEQTAAANVEMERFFRQELVSKQAQVDSLVDQEFQMRSALGILSLEEERLYLQTARENERQAKTAAEVEMGVLQARLNAVNQDKVDVKQRHLQAQMDEELALEGVNRDQLLETITLRQANIDSIGAKLDALAVKEEPLQDLQRQRAQLEIDIENLRDKMLAVHISTFAQLAQVRSINPAVVPDYPAYPEVVLYTVLGFVGGLLIAFFVLIAIDSVSGKVKTISDLHNIVGGQALGYVTSLMKAQAAGKPFKLFAKKDFLGGVMDELVFRLDQGEGSAALPLQITSFGDKQEDVASVMAIAAALARDGQQIVCGFGDGVAVPAVPAGLVGKVFFVRDLAEKNVPDAIYLQYVPDLPPWRAAKQAKSRLESIICLIPAGKMAEDRLADFQKSIATGGSAGLSYILVEV